MTNESEFQEIAHCGGQFTITITTPADGRRGVSFGVRHSKPTPAAWFAVYVSAHARPVAMIRLGGIGEPWNPAPVPDSYPVFVASDSTGMFGRECPACHGYWRSGTAPPTWKTTCPYCGLRAQSHHFLTAGHKRFIEAVWAFLERAAASDEDGEHVIDMDQVADAVLPDGKRPAFYYAEESQQNRYVCSACGDTNDILGTYGYCSDCGTWNGLQELKPVMTGIRERAKGRGGLEACVKDAVGAFDSFARQYAQQLARRVPMRAKRRDHLQRVLFHDPSRRAEELRAWFDIDLFDGMGSDDVSFVIRMFLRRHVYEHNGGEADERYIRESGDTSVRPKQALRETLESAMRTTIVVLRMAENLHAGFHDLFPPVEEPIGLQRDRQARIRPADPLP